MFPRALIIFTFFLSFYAHAQEDKYSWDVPYVCSIKDNGKRRCAQGSVVAYNKEGKQCGYGQGPDDSCQYFIVTTTHHRIGKNDFICFKDRNCKPQESVPLATKSIDNFNDVMVGQFYPRKQHKGFIFQARKEKSGDVVFQGFHTLTPDKGFKNLQYDYFSPGTKQINFVGKGNSRDAPFIVVRPDIKYEQLLRPEQPKEQPVRKLISSGKLKAEAHIPGGTSGSTIIGYNGKRTELQGVGLSRHQFMELSYFAGDEAVKRLFADEIKDEVRIYQEFHPKIGEVRWEKLPNGEYSRVIKLSPKYQEMFGKKELAYGAHFQVMHSGDPISDSGDPTSDSGDPTSDSGDPTSDSGDPTSDSGDPTSDSGDCGQKFKFVKHKNGLISHLVESPGLFLDGESILGFKLIPKKGDKTPVNVYANDEALFYIDELGDNYKIEPIYAHRVVNGKAVPVSLFDQRFQGKDSIKKEVCQKNGKVETCIEIETDMKNKKVNLTIKTGGKKAEAHKVVLDKNGYVEGTNDFSPWIKIPYASGETYIDITGIFFLNLRDVDSAADLSVEVKMKKVAEKNRPYLLFSNQPKGEWLGHYPSENIY